MHERSDIENPRLRTMVLIYEVDHGWRYRVGQRDDGNYDSAQTAFGCACMWLERHPEDKVGPAQ